MGWARAAGVGGGGYGGNLIDLTLLLLLLFLPHSVQLQQFED